MRMPVITTLGLGLALIAGTLSGGITAARPGFQAATPAATPVAPTPTESPAAVVTAAATPAAPAVATTDVVTLAAWYANDPSGDFIDILPLHLDPSLIAGPEPNAAAVGRVDFPDEGVPTLDIGDAHFESYARSEGDTPERWTWFDDAEGVRPATLVLQIAGTGGVYDGYYGTATFISRDEGGVGGVLVLALRPPSDAATTGDTQDSSDAPAQEAAPDETDITANPEEAPPDDALTEPAA